VSEADRQKWDKRYREGSYGDRTHPTDLLADWLPRLADGEPGGRALDVACGAGRNALFLAEVGYNVTAIDISNIALERAGQTARELGLKIDWILADLELGQAATGLPQGPFDLVVMIRYVNMLLIPVLASRLSDQGYLVCEEHLETDQEVIGPKNPAYRLKPDELLNAASGLEVQFYQEGMVEDPDGRKAALAQLVACRGTGD
jgi:SAM-dependent methyltransferase